MIVAFLLISYAAYAKCADNAEYDNLQKYWKEYDDMKSAYKYTYYPNKEDYMYKTIAEENEEKLYPLLPYLPKD